jgi:hypothetical protein
VENPIGSVAAEWIDLDDPPFVKIEGTYDSPPSEFALGEAVDLNVSLTGSFTGGTDHQGFLQLALIFVQNRSRIGPFVLLNMECPDRNPSGCTPPDRQTADGMFTINAPTSGTKFTVTFGVAGCTFCEIEWTYERGELEAGPGICDGQGCVEKPVPKPGSKTKAVDKIPRRATTGLINVGTSDSRGLSTGDIGVAIQSRVRTRNQQQLAECKLFLLFNLPAGQIDPSDLVERIGDSKTCGTVLLALLAALPALPTTDTAEGTQAESTRCVPISVKLTRDRGDKSWSVSAAKKPKVRSSCGLQPDGSLDLMLKTRKSQALRKHFGNKLKVEIVSAADSPRRDSGSTVAANFSFKGKAKKSKKKK